MASIVGTVGTPTRQKHDPAWKHCQMFKNGDKIHLKCLYCGKILKGGGIHRIKEHLAGQKGNGATCLKVQPDVRFEMLENLNGTSGKRRKREKLPEETLGYDNLDTSGVELLSNQCDLNAEVTILPVPEMSEHDSDAYENGEYDGSNKRGGRRKKGRVRKAPDGVSSSGMTLQKHDPAWKHCQTFKTEDRVQLKCIYCGKVFKGGGIHRIKEHLAGQKGNAATCLRVQPDVRLEMLESLNSLSAKKKNKQKLLEEMPDFGKSGNDMVEVLDNRRGLHAETDLFSMSDTREHDMEVYENREVGMNKTSDRQKEGRVRKAPDVDFSNVLGLTGFQGTNAKNVSDTVPMAVGRFFLDVGLSMDAVKSVYFQPMIDAIASQGPGAVGPSNHDLRSWILKNLVQEVRNDIEQCKRSWERTGCSILVNEWNSGKGKVLVNFMVYSPEGTTFLRSTDVSDTINSTDALYELIREAVVEVGLSNVVQVVTSSDDRYVIAGNKLSDTYPTVFWTPCAGRCIDLMLEDIGELPWVKIILEQAKSISRFIYTNNIVLNTMRRQTFGVDLVDLGITRPSTDFMTLKRMLNIKSNLQCMFTSEEWMGSPFSKKPEVFAILNCICSEAFWNECASITRLTDPILRLLRIVASEKRPAMGFVYAGLYRAKEIIKKELVNKEEYLVYWNIIDRRWVPLQHHPLHAAGFYFNPKFFYSLEAGLDLHVRPLAYDCIEKLVPDSEVQDKIMMEIPSYHSGTGEFGRKMAIRARDTILPAEWWLTYGGGCPNLTRLATRILSQTCSLIQYRLDKVPFEYLHENKNCLEHQRLADLVFVQSNMLLKRKILGKKQQGTIDPISYENIDIVEDWVVGEDSCSDGSGNSDWAVVDPPFGNFILLGSETDDIESLGAGFDDYEIFGGI